MNKSRIFHTYITERPSTLNNIHRWFSRENIVMMHTGRAPSTRREV